MQTQLADFIRDTPEGKEAEHILNKCVHCGFCTATCPTYQLRGDELDGPRGRIYLIKSLLEGGEVSARTRLHLDRCLTCRSCETTCPSGVEYGHLADIGRAVLEQRAPARPFAERARRWLLAQGASRPALFSTAYKLGRSLRPHLPPALAAKIAPVPDAGVWPEPRHARRWLVLGGCVQSSMAPQINAAAARLLDRIGISLIELPHDGCCGALRYHLDDQAGGRRDAASLMARWWPLLQSGDIEGVLVTASGCGSFMRDYAHLFARSEADLLARGEKVAALMRDVSELVAAEAESLSRVLVRDAGAIPLAFHSPCTLQHGLQIRGVVEGLLTRAGYTLTPVADPHLCCGSAGAYSLLQPEIAGQLRERKLTALQQGEPAGIATANIGCLSHLGAAARVPVRHWIEWLDERLTAT
ncbi:glycolate oxidase subunit GlcF [Niveibacterium sp. SC-1]|uniref:glycolate oxidase subunit GlcF n=1 Tax=Niveibacterium sp. SC-1 TaxID=3135646 RepID=UPI00311DE7B5